MSLIIRDFREKGFFSVDNEFVDGGWIQKIGPEAFTVYSIICRHANINTGKTRVSYQTIANLSGISRRQVIREIKKLCAYQMIEIPEKRVGRGNVNEINVIDKSQWLTEPILSYVAKKVTHSHYYLKGDNVSPNIIKGDSGDIKKVTAETPSYIISKLLKETTTGSKNNDEPKSQTEKTAVVAVPTSLTESLPTDAEKFLSETLDVSVNKLRTIATERHTTLAELYQGVVYALANPWNPQTKRGIQSPVAYLQHGKDFDDAGQFVYRNGLGQTDIPALIDWFASIDGTLRSRIVHHLQQTVTDFATIATPALRWCHKPTLLAVAKLYHQFQKTGSLSLKE